MKKKYYAPTVEMLLLQIDDIIVASGLIDGGAGGGVINPGENDDWGDLPLDSNWN